MITVLSQKGGAGKSTLTMQLAGGLARAGRRVAIIDLDPGSLRWAQSADPATPFRPTWCAPRGRACRPASADQATRKGVDHVLGLPAFHRARRHARRPRRADLALVPVVPSPADLWSTGASSG